MPTVTGRATDFITFSRPGATGGGATVTDSDGRIRWAGHNLLTNSESFDASAWSKSGLAATPIAANSAVAPNGTTTADKLVENTSNSTHFVRQLVTVASGDTYHISAWVKAAGRNWAALTIAAGPGYYFNLSTGAVGSAVSGTGTVSSPYITDAGSGWWKVGFTIVTGNTTGGVDVYTASADATASYTGDGTSGVLVWGAHLYRSDLGSMVLNPARGDAYYPTTPRNLLGFTEDFSNAAFVKQDIAAFGSGSIANAAIAPNGLQTADLVVPSTAATAHSIYQVATTGGLNTQSVYVKPAGYTKIALRESQTGAYYVSFNLVGAGSVLDSSGATGAITALSDGWYRISMIGTLSGTTRWSVYFLSPSYTSGSVFATWSGDGTSGIYLWGAQLSDSASLDAYSPVYGAAVTSAAYYAPRLDYDANGSALGLLVEEQRTNSLQHSNSFSTSPWVLTGSGSVTSSTAISPDGTNNGWTLTGVSASSGVYQLVTGSTNTAYTTTVFAKANLISTLRFGLTNQVESQTAYYTFTLTGSGTVAPFQVASFTSVTAAIAPVGNGWYRCTVSATSPVSGLTSVGAMLRTDAAGTLYIYGAQLEAGSFATSYIPTGASTATRTADVASVSTQAFPYSATETTLYAEGLSAPGWASGVNQIITSIGEGAPSNNQITLYRVANTSLTQLITSGGTVSSNLSAGIVPANSTVYKFITAAKVNDFAFCVNANTVATDTSGAMPGAVTKLEIGNWNGGSGSTWNGHIRRIAVFPRRLSNSELQARTA